MSVWGGAIGGFGEVDERHQSGGGGGMHAHAGKRGAMHWRHGRFLMTGRLFTHLDVDLRLVTNQAVAGEG